MEVAANMWGLDRRGTVVHLSDKEDHQSSRGCINHRKVGGRAICNVGNGIFCILRPGCIISEGEESTGIPGNGILSCER